MGLMVRNSKQARPFGTGIKFEDGVGVISIRAHWALFPDFRLSDDG